jgi:prepilin-type N-terminal cleavage/methylation domain-containing protein
MYRRNKQKGFTLIELLVVIAVIGLLASLIAVGFGNARRKSRDAKRLSDMQQVRTGLDLYYTNGGYPGTDVWNTGNLTCTTADSIMQVPKDATTGLYYNYQVAEPVSGCGTTLYRTYYVEFATESETDIGPAGTYYASPNGITVDPPFTP